MYIFLLLTFIFACYGISNTIVFGSGPFGIIEKFRKLIEKVSPKLHELFTCMMCLPMWVGMLLSIINIIFLPALPFTPFNLILGYDGLGIIKAIFIVFLDGSLSSGTTWLIHNIEEHFERS